MELDRRSGDATALLTGLGAGAGVLVALSLFCCVLKTTPVTAATRTMIAIAFFIGFLLHYNVKSDNRLPPAPIPLPLDIPGLPGQPPFPTGSRTRPRRSNNYE